jgi:hypothetical protein
VVVLASVADSELSALRSTRGRHGSLTVVQFDRSSWEDGWTSPASAPSTGLVLVTGAMAFSDAWNRSMHPRARSLSGTPAGRATGSPS